MNKMTRRLVEPNLRMVFPTLVTIAIIIAAISVIDSSFLYNTASGQNTTSQTTGSQTVQNLIEKVKPALEQIDQARDALRNNDSSTALDKINLADTELFKITENLPASEED
jgi:ABC-type phosphate transport system substrate-binding protein